MAKIRGDKIHDFLRVHVEDLVETIGVYGEIMTRRVKLGTLNHERFWNIRNELLRHIKNEFMAESSS